MNHTSSLRYAVAGEKNEKIIYKEKSYELQGAIFEVYKKMGSGFLIDLYYESKKNTKLIK